MFVVLVGFAVFLYTPKYTQDSIGAPARITIPGINVDAAIEQVALTTDGFMDVPKLPLDTAWYMLGPRPGEQGSAVIAGHVDWKDGSRAVFADLHTLKPGDRVAVQDDKGVVVSFVVRTSRTYDANAYAEDVFISNDGKAHLNLVTCSGVWNIDKKEYSQRLVVFTDQEI